MQLRKAVLSLKMELHDKDDDPFDERHYVKQDRLEALLLLLEMKIRGIEMS